MYYFLNHLLLCYVMTAAKVVYKYQIALSYSMWVKIILIFFLSCKGAYFST